jgi:hypothetical protein
LWGFGAAALRLGAVGALGALGASLLAGLAAATPGAKETTQPPGGNAETPLAIGQEAYVYGYPLMVVDATKQQSFNGGSNRFVYLPAPPPPTYKAIVRPNVDTLYTTAFLDLSAEPVVVHMPDMHGRYDVMEVMDAYTNVIASPGKRTTGTGARDFLFVGPHWKAPVQLVTGMTEVRSPTNMVWIVNRTQLDGEHDIPAVNALQRQFATARWSEWPKGAVQATPMEGGQTLTETPPAQIQKLHAPAYFDRMALLLRDNPPVPDPGVLRRFATIGLVPAHPFDPSPDLALTLEKARDRAQEDIKQRSDSLGKVVNGWHVLTQDKGTGVGTYGTDYLQRAAVTDYGLGANLPEDAVYPGTDVDATGQPLTGDKTYSIHFEKDQLPPVNAFWSMTLYDQYGYFVPNPLGRYAARDSTLQRNADGSVDIFVQPDSPGKDREPNWLPSPREGRFNLLLRMYWPKKPVIDGSYAPPGVRLGQAR